MKFRDRFPKVRLPLWATLLSAVLLAGAITLLALWCQPNALRSVLAVFRGQPLLIVLNCLPVGLLLLAFTCLFRNVFFSGALVNLAVGLLSVANRIKIEVRDEPVFPRDFALLKEVGSAVGNYDIHYPVSAIALVVGFSLVLVLAGLLVGCRSFPIARLRGWLGSLLGAAASFAVLAGLILTVYASNDLYNSFRVSNASYVPSVFNELGFPYCFCHQFTTYLVDKPEGFDRAEAEAWDQGGQTGLGEDVNVIMVMNEAFSDITEDDAFAFTAEDDPLQNLHALEQDPHAVSGHIVVSGFAGGTANTEFDVVTGMQASAISADNPSSFRVVNRDLDSLFRLFGDDGYHTSFFHPGDDWFYNRENVYRWFGAEETVFIDQMESPAYKGRWVTDDYMAGLIEQEFEDAVADGEPLFHYTTTIQNHMSYTADKYGEGYDYPEVPLNVAVSDEVASMLEVYVEGVRDADAMLGRLVDYFSQRSEPVVLVFLGDHLPYLGDNQKAYAELGMEIALPEAEQADPLCAYETPYVVWANDAAAQALDWETAAAALDLPESGTISASFLGAMVVELTGRTGESPWFDFLNQLRRVVPAVRHQTYLLADGTYRTVAELTATAEGQEAYDLVLKWRQWSYYKLLYKEMD
ncbi:MAG TPA: LTA synthase family protein [Candidatus Oscillibacter excrementigallinarum]|uniref:LTA synthase family protein n=1 Tax=Candidatus Oscillibacter excrementigallinarum TaxID=2838716 RepID=A0A9D2RRL7_9FIRM|nr:LTA synthase family protein [Candidatus Oscillibacter excrementigallinarum]